MTAEPRWEELPDRELVDQALHADSPADRESAFGTIFARHHRGVLAFCGGHLQNPHSAADVAAQTFTDAFTRLATLNEPDKLRGWLFGIASHHCSTEHKRARRQAPLPELGAGGEDEVVSYERASRARHAEVDRLLDAVVATFTAKQRQVFQLAVRQGLAGAQLGKVLAVKPEEASRQASEIITVAYQGFGAIVLARDGRRYCPVLARILDQYAWTGQNFTKKLRLRIVRHLNSCLTCDNCATCGTQRDRLVRPLAPALIPILIVGEVTNRVDADIKKRAQGKGKARGGGKKHSVAGAGTAVAVILATTRLLIYLHTHAAPGPPATVSVWVPAGSVTVTSSPAGLNCTGLCHQPFTSGSQLTLTSDYRPGGLPLNWIGCDKATASAADICVVTLTTDRAVCIAPYDPPFTVMTPEDCASRATG
jgi:RNA polymerase sigma factor (sigma-70 family)